MPGPAVSCPFVWTVTTARPANFAIDYKPLEGTITEYELKWQAQAGFKTVRFVNGIGITGFAFDHGPSGAAVELTLVAFRPRK
jgi:hypothetical protein